MREAAAPTPLKSPVASGTERRLWYPPMKLWQLYACMLVTANLYSLYWIYRIARDVRDHADARVRPVAYSVSLLLGIVAVFSGARLTWRVLSLRGGERTRHQNLPPVVSLLAFCAYFLAFLAYLGEVPALFVASLLAFPLPWLLVQHRMNAIVASLPASDLRAPTQRLGVRRLAALTVGLPVWAGLLSAVQMQAAPHPGETAFASRLLTGIGARYTVRVPADDWRRVPPGTIGDPRADMALLGPTGDTWALVYVHSGVALDEVVAFRARHIHRYEVGGYDEVRAPRGDNDVAMSYVAYESRDPFGRTWTWVTTAASAGAVVELIVSARDPAAGRPGSVARSLAVATPRS